MACILFSSALQSSQPMGSGDGTIYLDPSAGRELGLVLSGLTPSYRVSVPCNNVLMCGFEYYVQAVYVDPVNLGQVAFTPAIQLVLGN